MSVVCVGAAMTVVLTGCSTPAAWKPTADRPARLDAESPAERLTALIRESNLG